jgi:hypothetical protein
MRFFALAATLAAGGCGGSASVKPAGPPPCETRVVATHPADTVTVVVFDKIDLSHAPWPRNREERFVFSHLYETLVKVDCRGMVQPGLAKSWKKASDGWYIELQEDAHFWDDTMVTTNDVKSSFEPAIRAGIAIDRVDIVDETHAIIHGDFEVKLLAVPMLAIRKESTSGVPMGTGAWTIDPATATDGIIMHPLAGAAPVVRVMREDAVDAMDILNGSADAMITDDPTAIDYARERHAAIAPLEWDRAYVLIAPMRGSVTDLPRHVCDALARDAVAIDSRGGSNILDESRNACAMHISDIALGILSSSQLFFDGGDPTARSLAERIVALAAMDTASSAEARAIRAAVPEFGPSLRAVALKHEQPSEKSPFPVLPVAHYVKALSWYGDLPCLGASFMKGMPWLASLEPLSAAVLPLVETRAHFIAISDRVSYIDEHNGTVRIIPPGVERVR